jgi:ABC-2 type transport system ATP-binding protein
MEEADQLCDRVAILDQGRIVALETPKKLKVAFGKGDQVTLEDVFVSLTGHPLVFS